MTFNYNKNNSSLYNFFKTTNSQTGPKVNMYYTNGSDLITSKFKLYMFGTRSKCGYQNDSNDIGNYYQIDNYTNATKIGNYNMYPWYVSDAHQQNAVWLYNSTTYINNTSLWFYYTFYYSGNNNTGTLYASSDDNATFYLNQGTGIDISQGVPLSGGIKNPNRGGITIRNGLNYIRVSLYNSINEGGILIAIYDSGGTNIVNTDTTWAVSTSASYNSVSLTYNSSAT